MPQGVLVGLYTWIFVTLIDHMLGSIASIFAVVALALAALAYAVWDGLKDANDQ